MRSYGIVGFIIGALYTPGIAYFNIPLASWTAAYHLVYSLALWICTLLGALPESCVVGELKFHAIAGMAIAVGQILDHRRQEATSRGKNSSRFKRLLLESASTCVQPQF